jgi:hypothetical protein
VFTIAGVNDVNPVTKADLGRLKQFVCISYSANSLGDVSGHDLDGRVPERRGGGGHDRPQHAAITGVGTASTAYRQNLVFHKNAFALAMVPLISPPGATSGHRVSRTRERASD